MENSKIEYDCYLNPGSYVEGEEKKYHVRLNKRPIVTVKEISEYLEHACTLTSADIAGVLSGLRDMIVSSLAKGQAVNLADICKIEPVLGVMEGECTGREKGDEVTLKAIRMRAFKVLENDVRKKLYPRARRKGKHSAKLSKDQLYAKMTEFLKDSESITRKDLVENYGLTNYMARKYIMQFVEEGALRRPRNTNDSEYRPAPGYFGRAAE